MSWWDSGLTSFAASALKNAQKRIDKALDIDETGDMDGKQRATNQQGFEGLDDNKFWSNWALDESKANQTEKFQKGSSLEDDFSTSMLDEKPEATVKKAASLSRKSPSKKAQPHVIVTSLTGSAFFGAAPVVLKDTEEPPLENTKPRQPTNLEFGEIMTDSTLSETAIMTEVSESIDCSSNELVIEEKQFEDVGIVLVPLDDAESENTAVDDLNNISTVKADKDTAEKVLPCDPVARELDTIVTKTDTDIKPAQAQETEVTPNSEAISDSHAEKIHQDNLSANLSEVLNPAPREVNGDYNHPSEMDVEHDIELSTDSGKHAESELEQNLPLNDTQADNEIKNGLSEGCTDTQPECRESLELEQADEKIITEKPEKELPITAALDVNDHERADISESVDSPVVYPVNVDTSCYMRYDESNDFDAADLNSQKKPSSRSSPSNSNASTNGWIKAPDSMSASMYSGCDDLETATSSDIEVLSMPTSNGCSSDSGRKFISEPTGMSSNKQQLISSLYTGHHRQESQSSSTTSDDLVPSDLLVTVVDQDILLASYEPMPIPTTESSNTEVSLGSSVDSVSSRLSAASDATVHESSSVDTITPFLQPEKLLKKLAEITQRLEARESRLLEMSKENSDLVEANSILESQLRQSESARESEMTDVNQLTNEFTQRIAESEKKLQLSLKERDHLKTQLHNLQEQIAKSAADKKLMRLVEEKDEQISELMAEGEKLSKQQLLSNTIIKKLRVKEKETESILKSQEQKMRDQASELEKMQESLKSKEKYISDQEEAITKLQAGVNSQVSEMENLKLELDERNERVRGLQSTLDKSFKEIADLHKASAEIVSENNRTKLEMAEKTKNEMRHQLETSKRDWQQQQELITAQLDQAQFQLQRREKEFSRQEMLHRQEMEDFQTRLQESENRNDELSSSVAAATKPLLRQIDSLQAAHATQCASWEKVERNLSDRLAECQSQLMEVTEKERVANERLSDLQSRVRGLELQVSTLREEKLRLTSELELCRSELSVAEEAKSIERSQLDALRKSYTAEIDDLKRQKTTLEQQLDLERLKAESEKRKSATQETIQEDTRAQVSKPGAQNTLPSAHHRTSSPKPNANSSNATTPTLPANSMLSSMHSSIYDDDGLESSFTMLPGLTSSTMHGSVYEATRHTPSILVEQLQSQLKMKDGEIAQLQSEISSLERTREALARELVSITAERDLFEQQSSQLMDLQTEYAALEVKQQALLQMYGEKVEETVELRMDLQDVKEMYKSQDHTVQ